MKRAILFAVLALFAATSFANDNKPKAPKRVNWDPEIYGPLYGNVESITITEYTLKIFLKMLSKMEY